MESVLKLIQRADCAAPKTDIDEQRLLSEIKDVSRLLAYNECWFQLECDENLIDACIYQREELRARYRYLLNLARQMGVSSAAFQN